MASIVADLEREGMLDEREDGTGASPRAGGRRGSCASVAQRERSSGSTSESAISGSRPRTSATPSSRRLNARCGPTGGRKRAPNSRRARGRGPRRSWVLAGRGDRRGPGPARTDRHAIRPGGLVVHPPGWVGVRAAEALASRLNFLSRWTTTQISAHSPNSTGRGRRLPKRRLPEGLDRDRRGADR